MFWNGLGTFFLHLIEFDLYFVASEYLVYIKIKYENNEDCSICEKFSKYFLKEDDGFCWKSEIIYLTLDKFIKSILITIKNMASSFIIFLI